MTIPVAPAKLSASDPKKISSVWVFIKRFNDLIDWITSLSPSGATQYDTGWIDLSVTGSGWTTPLGAQTPQCRRIGNVVHFRGILANSTFSGGFTTIGTVPSGYRPSSGNGAVASATQNSASVASVRAYPNGDLQFYAAAASSAYYSLSELSFPLG